MRKKGITKYFPSVVASLIGGGIVLSALNPEFKATLTKNFNKETISNTIESAQDYVEDKWDKFVDSFKSDDVSQRSTVVENDSLHSTDYASNSSSESSSVVNETESNVTEEPVEEVVIYDEYTDSYLLEQGYEFKDIDVEAYNAENSDYVGYIDVPGTSMDYPVYQRENDETNDYYLHRDRKGKDYYEGEIYLDTRVDLSLGDDSSTMQNTTIPIFGHAMADWRPDPKFNNLKFFKQQSFLDNHPYGVYYNEDGSVYALEIVAGYITNGVTDENFMIYNLDNEANFNIYKNYINENALVKSDVDLQYGDKIVNLVTCSYESGYDSPKFVVVCKAVKQYTDENQITNDNEKVRKLTK
jgi:SrtB family sortase